MTISKKVAKGFSQVSSYPRLNNSTLVYLVAETDSNTAFVSTRESEKEESQHTWSDQGMRQHADLASQLAFKFPYKAKTNAAPCASPFSRRSGEKQ